MKKFLVFLMFGILLTSCSAFDGKAMEAEVKNVFKNVYPVGTGDSNFVFIAIKDSGEVFFVSNASTFSPKITSIRKIPNLKVKIIK